MTPEEMQKRSSEKVKQVLSLMKMLHLTTQARQQITKEGFLENVIYWLDEEKYPAAEPAQPVAPAGEPQKSPEDTKGEAHGTKETVAAVPEAAPVPEKDA